jgi:transposase
MTRRNQHYPPELRERAVRMVAEVTPNYDSQWAAIGAVAQKLGVGTAKTVCKWVRQAEVDPMQMGDADEWRADGVPSRAQPALAWEDAGRAQPQAGVLRSHR